MNKPLYLTLFVAMVVAQLGVPASMIAKREITLQQGVEYKFRCAPIDPYDAFRGKYVRLGITAGSAVPWKGESLQRNQDVYVLLEIDEDGFAIGKEISLTRPESGDYVQAKVRWNSFGQEEIPLEYPFDRYYMEESIAAEAERAYRDANRRGQRATYITVRVRNGFGVLEELYIEGMPVLEYLDQEGNGAK